MQNYIIIDNSEYSLVETCGNKLEDFEVLQTLGKGSYGYVAKVKSRKDHKLYAMKMIDFSMMKDPTEINFSFNEINIIQSLDNPHITKYYNSFQIGNKLYIIMEYMDNGDLKGYLEANKTMNKPIPEKEIWEIFYQCAAALNYIHRNKLIHRDIKPANLFMTNEKTIKIGDFGVSSNKKQFINQNNQMCNLNDKETLMVGTPAYMSPEIMNHLGYDNKVDVYALGITFHEICYFNIPRSIVQAIGPQGIYVKVEDVPPQSNVNYYSKDIYNLIQWMTQKDPNQRPNSYKVLNYIKKIYNLISKNNSTIDGVFRCLFSFQNLTNYLIKNKNFIKQTSADRPICRMFTYLISKMDSNKWPNELNEFRNVLTFENPCFPDPEQIDPIELIKFMLIRFHKETTIDPNITPENPYFYTPDNNPSILNRQQSFINYGQFSASYKSCVADFFFGTYEIVRFCNNCKKKKFYFSNFTHIVFDIDEALKNNLGGNNNFLLYYFQKQNSICRNKLGYCLFCNNNTMHLETQKFLILPYNLIICFKGEQKNYDNNYVKYPNRLDLSSLGLQGDTFTYTLKGVIKSYMENEIKYYMCIYEDNRKKSWIMSDGYTKSSIISPLNHSIGNVVMLFYSTFG